MTSLQRERQWPILYVADSFIASPTPPARCRDGSQQWTDSSAAGHTIQPNRRRQGKIWASVGAYRSHLLYDSFVSSSTYVLQQYSANYYVP